MQEEQNIRRVGILSGTFDPIHKGHIVFAEEAINSQGLDKVFFLVEPRPRRKQGVKAFEHRLKMVQLALASKPKLGVIVLGQTRFTATYTLPLLEARFKGAELSMLMGDDMLLHLAEWPNVEKLIKNVTFIIGARRTTTDDIKELIHKLEVTKGIKFEFRVFESPLAVSSSSSVRQQIRRGQIPEEIDPGVANYIKENGLYVSATNS